MSADYLSIPGYLPVKQAAQRKGISDKRIFQFIADGRLPARRVGGRWLISEEALDGFEAQPHGRIRTRPVEWLHYRAGARVFLRHITAPVLPGCEEALSKRLSAIAKKQRHCFPGTMQRFLFVAEELLHVVLIWKDTEINLDALERDMAVFRAAVEKLVDWQAATDETSEVAAHT